MTLVGEFILTGQGLSKDPSLRWPPPNDGIWQLNRIVVVKIFNHLLEAFLREQNNHSMLQKATCKIDTKYLRIYVPAQEFLVFEVKEKEHQASKLLYI